MSSRSLNRLTSAWMYRPTPVPASSLSARVSNATRSGPFSLPLWGRVGWGRSGVGIEPSLLAESLHHVAGG